MTSNTHSVLLPQDALNPWTEGLVRPLQFGSISVFGCSGGSGNAIYGADKKVHGKNDLKTLYCATDSSTLGCVEKVHI